MTAKLLDRHHYLSYDSLIVAAGAGQSYFGNDHFAEFAPGMKSIDDALELRGRIFGSFELAEVADDPAERERLMTFVVVGAGPTGVEMAGQIAELSHRTLRRDFRRIDTRDARVILLDFAPTVLGAFGDRLGAKAADKLRDIGVELQLGSKVVNVDATGIEVEDSDGTHRRIDSVCKVWAAGVQASPLGKMLADQSGAGIDRAGRVMVNPDLTLPGHPEVYVVGDMMSLDKLPGVAQVAIQGGRYAAKAIKARSPVSRPVSRSTTTTRAAWPRSRGSARSQHRQDPPQRLHRLGHVAGGPPRLHHRLQEPDHHAAALGGQLRRPRPVRAHDDPAADVRPAGAAAPRRRLPAQHGALHPPGRHDADRARAPLTRPCRDGRRRPAVPARPCRLTTGGPVHHNGPMTFTNGEVSFWYRDIGLPARRPALPGRPRRRRGPRRRRPDLAVDGVLPQA